MAAALHHDLVVADVDTLAKLAMQIDSDKKNLALASAGIPTAMCSLEMRIAIASAVA